MGKYTKPLSILNRLVIEILHYRNDIYDTIDGLYSINIKIMIADCDLIEWNGNEGNCRVVFFQENLMMTSC